MAIGTTGERAVAESEFLAERGPTRTTGKETGGS